MKKNVLLPIKTLPSPFWFPDHVQISSFSFIFLFWFHSRSAKSQILARDRAEEKKSSWIRDASAPLLLRPFCFLLFLPWPIALSFTDLGSAEILHYPSSRKRARYHERRNTTARVQFTFCSGWCEGSISTWSHPRYCCASHDKKQIPALMG